MHFQLEVPLPGQPINTLIGPYFKQVSLCRKRIPNIFSVTERKKKKKKVYKSIIEYTSIIWAAHLLYLDSEYSSLVVHSLAALMDMYNVIPS